jgi:hypothetical protein
MRVFLLFFSLTMSVIAFPGCQDDEKAEPPVDIDYEALDAIDISQSTDGIVPLPASVGTTLNSIFVKYTKVTAPNGKPIHLMAQDGISDLQFIKAREVLIFHLTNVPGSRYGSDKSAVANQLANVRALMPCFDSEETAGAARPMLQRTELTINDVLFARECPIEGSQEYLNNTVRDATYEEVFHLVQGNGIIDALPEFHVEIVKATHDAVAAEKYYYDDNPQRPLEYIITGVDVYYGLWAHDPDENGHAFGPEYIYNTRERLESGDPALFELVESYWPEYLKYDVYLDPSFEGTFSLVLDENQVYTLKSQYLVNIRLTGEKNSAIFGNDQDNTFLGNPGDNVLTGAKGDDTLDGGPGDDIAFFVGSIEEYEMSREDEKITVTDKVGDRDGTDVLTNIEILQFKDKRIISSSVMP